MSKISVTLDVNWKHILDGLCVLFAAKKYLGFQSYPDLVELIDAAGKPMGKYCRSEKFASKISAVMSKHFKDEFVNFFYLHRNLYV